MITVKNFTFNPIAVNTYLLYDETKDAVLIDCGCSTPGEEKFLSSYISENNLKIRRLLCTHLHFDHVLGNAFAQQTYDVQPEAHRYETEQLPSPKEQVRFMRFPVQTDFAAIGKYLVDRETIVFGQSELTVLHVPGHSPGSVCFYGPNDDLIVTGDVLFRGSIGRTDLWGGDCDRLLAGIRKHILTLPENTRAYPGHGNATTVGFEKQYNPFLRE
ncbi:MAG: MBL fold metallo-hydrolase [Tannerella sp.]|nr:MBL fold metallo-hydrolase [Tannerella sp.]